MPTPMEKILLSMLTDGLADFTRVISYLAIRLIPVCFYRNQQPDTKKYITSVYFGSLCFGVHVRDSPQQIRIRFAVFVSKRITDLGADVYIVHCPVVRSSAGFVPSDPIKVPG